VPSPPWNYNTTCKRTALLARPSNQNRAEVRSFQNPLSSTFLGTFLGIHLKDFIPTATRSSLIPFSQPCQSANQMPRPSGRLMPSGLPRMGENMRKPGRVSSRRSSDRTIVFVPPPRLSRGAVTRSAAPRRFCSCPGPAHAVIPTR